MGAAVSRYNAPMSRVLPLEYTQTLEDLLGGLSLERRLVASKLEPRLREVAWKVRDDKEYPMDEVTVLGAGGSKTRAIAPSGTSTEASITKWMNKQGTSYLLGRIQPLVAGELSVQLVCCLMTLESHESSVNHSSKPSSCDFWWCAEATRERLGWRSQQGALWDHQREGIDQVARAPRSPPSPTKACFIVYSRRATTRSRWRPGHRHG